MARDRATMGAWQVRGVKQVVAAAQGEETRGSAAEGHGGAGIGFHWDKDEDLAAAAHVHMHPLISTVRQALI